jgi:transcription initiation factor IIF auxiliary subunit
MYARRIKYYIGGEFVMTYLYVLKSSSYGSSNNNNEVVNEFRMVQHTEKYTEEEFCVMVDQYRYESNGGFFPHERSLWELVKLLEENHGFVVVPMFSL